MNYMLQKWVWTPIKSSSVTRYAPNFLQSSNAMGFMKFGDFSEEKMKIWEIWGLFDSKWAILGKKWNISK